MVLREKYDIYSFLGAICILIALMFMVFWYTCSLEVQDREMPKIKLPERSKVPPKVKHGLSYIRVYSIQSIRWYVQWLQNTLQRTPTKSDPNCISSTPVPCKPQGCFSRNKSENLLATYVNFVHFSIIWAILGKRLLNWVSCQHHRHRVIISAVLGFWRVNPGQTMTMKEKWTHHLLTATKTHRANSNTNSSINLYSTIVHFFFLTSHFSHL